MNSNNTDNYFADAWAVHAEHDGKPRMCGWAKTEQEAKAEAKRLEQTDADSQNTEYWVMQMTQDELQSFKASGFIPQDA